jgi:hypothetical protein
MRRILLALAAVFLLSQCYCASKKRAAMESPAVGSVNPNITFLPAINRTYNQKKWNPIIERIIKEMENSPPCSSAFSQAGVDLKQLLDKGLVIGPADIIAMSPSEALTAKTTSERCSRTSWFMPRAFRRGDQALSRDCWGPRTWII